MENIDTKIKTISDEINCICDEHEINEDLVLKCAELINTRRNLEYQAKNEVWEKVKPEHICLDAYDLKEYHLPDSVKVAIHYKPNREKWLFNEINSVFDVDVCDIFDYAYTEEVDNDYEQMCHDYNPQDPEFIVWCLKRQYPNKHIEYHSYNGCCQGDVYDCFFMADIEDGKHIDISQEISIVRDYCENHFDQYSKASDEYDNSFYTSTIFNTYLSMLNKGKPSWTYLDNEELVKQYLKSVSGTDRNIVIKY